MITKASIPDICWPQNAREAIAIQEKLRGEVRIYDDFAKIEYIAGIDCSYDIKNNLSFAVIVIMKMDELTPIDIVRAELPTHFPYVPGLLSFREIPVILAAFNQLQVKPDLLMVDGHGIAHPRRLGIAAHLGVLLDIPSIGVAKSKLTGQYREPNLTKGSRNELTDKGIKIGTVLRPKDKVKPLFISPGHRIGQEKAVDLVFQCLTKYRLPEPTRIADKISKIKPVAKVL
ncbi:deoxyribonuclease V [Legionella maioricensis]|uniref:Endonuclease V n=1 Tax=Legionella maioricensis TaxID=2896528 RepID=A0A9X2ICF2_9GAMM|nr:deoxyribonuclease V [Legionella maioricensis]MCL9685370.1 deoxyribonuclease V [Legionella maioricensis]MCL9688671.1 deoxyribonuclease V [Legionella maioricensis]